jgi:RNA polymerase sigma factor (sigma-70 family)
MSALAGSTPGDVGDLELLRLYARAGGGASSEEAFRLIVERHIDLVYSAALRQLRGDAHLGEDATQAVFMLLARQAGKVDERIILPAWLYRATHFVCRNARTAEMRRKRREMAYIASASSSRSSQTSAADAGGADADWQGCLPLLDEAMASLGETDRTVLLLRFFQGRSVQEVGTAVGLSGNATTKRIERAVGKLRRYFARRGVGIAAGALISGLSVGAVQAAPAGLSMSVSGAAVTAATATAAASASASGHALAKGVLLAMAWSSKAKMVAATVAALLLLTAGTTAVVYFAGARRGSAPPDTIVLATPSASLSPARADSTSASAAPLPEYFPGGTIPVLAQYRKAEHLLDEVIEAETYDDARGVQVVAPGLAGWEDGNLVHYQRVDFGQPPGPGARSKGCATHFIASIASNSSDGGGGRLEVRIDDPTAPPICSLEVVPTGGVLHRAARIAPLAAPVAGFHDVYLTLQGGNGKAATNLDWFKFARLPRWARDMIQAEDYDAMFGVRTLPAFVAHLDRGDFLGFRSVDFGPRGPTYVHVRCGVRAQYAGRSIQFRLDSPAGEVIASLKVRDTGEFTNFQTQSTRVGQVRGTHDLYVTFTGNGTADLDWFQFSDDETPPEPPPPPPPPAPVPLPTTLPATLPATLPSTQPATRPASP